MNEDLMPSRRLCRSRKERMVAGVAGGLGQYLDVDPTLVRLVFVVLTLTGGFGLLAYLILAIVMPKRPAGEPEPEITWSIGGNRGREIAALALILVGLLWLASNMGLFRFIHWGTVWPLILIAAGVLLLVNRVPG